MHNSLIFIKILQFFIAFIVTAIQTWLFHKTIGSNPRWRGFPLLMVVIIFTVIELVLQLYLTQVSWVAGVLVVSLYVLYPVVFMGGKIKERILFGIINVTLIYFSALLRYIIMYPLSSQQTEANLAMSFTSLILQLIIYIISAMFVIHLNTEGKRYISHKYWIVISISFFAIFVAIMVEDLFNNKKGYPSFHSYVTTVTLVLLIIWLLMYFIFYFICRYFSRTIEANALVIQNDAIERYVLRKQASDERIKILSHDLKHSLIQWRKFAEEKGDSKALDTILEYEEQLRSTVLINVEHENANAIINQKYWEAQQEKIQFSIEGAFYKDLVVSKLDLCSILGNLLDNAIEAAAQVEENIIRRVNLYIKRKGNLLILKVENNYSLEPIIEDGVFITRKKDKFLHSIGTRSLSNVAEKYNGAINYSYENNWFETTIMLNAYEDVFSDRN